MFRKFILNIKLRKKWYHQCIYDIVLMARRFRLPFPELFGAFFFHILKIWLVLWRRTKQFFFYEPMFRYRCTSVGKSLYLEVNFPLILGYGSIRVGDNVTIGGNATFIVSYKNKTNPTITIGDDVYIGYASLLSCADKISIGNNVKIAELCRIYDNNNHPIDPAARTRNEPIGAQDISPVVIEDEAWIGARSTILKGVTVGKGAIVAADAVVTKDVRALTVVAGNPAQVVKEIMVKK
ncbi:Acetyltransferase (isoleucine patch superfamily) [Candidatus Electrothrix marina]|uniref:Acetyltransferase (Isoleucine patch superfamily) n=1 Tax=Candidatus Electrothrix marina TaxID=1859130 RepID=A0A444JCG6_9BACT|nr:Acetyltransferase (isoleucine patch superfamily) [Candidatus Electrothrix marina]